MSKKKKKSLLWKIWKEDKTQASYLFGTMHVKNKDALNNNHLIYEKIEECAAFATEVSLDILSQNISPDFFNLPKGQSLQNLLSEKQYSKLKKTLKKAFNIDIAMFGSSKPIVISNLITHSILTGELPVSLDEHLWRYAKNKGKQTLGIETFEEQMEIMQKISIEHQLKALLWIGQHVSKYRKQLFQMTEIYLSEDIQKLHKLAKKNAKEMRKVLIYKRNEIMAERLEKMMNDQTVFAAIGAGHLAGEKGVLRLLKLRGFSVKPLNGK